MPKIGSSDRPDWPLAVVVGAGGLGIAVARRLGLSHRLLVADRDTDHVEARCAELRRDGHDATPITCDVSSAADVRHVAAAANEAGRVTTLAHVVGLAPAAKDFQLIVEVNLVGAHRVAAAFHEVLAPGGAAVFVSSSSAHMSTISPEIAELLDTPDSVDLIGRLRTALGDAATPANAYTLSKAGLNRMCRRLAPSWGRRGQRIVSISPGLIATPQGAESYKHSTSKLALFNAVPLGRECSMLEIAGVIAFLISDAASYISGIDILVDGGLIAAVNGEPRSPSIPD